MPPPPPPAPPPLPKLSSGASNASGKLNNFEPPPDRNALLSQIRKGTRLKKAETNDRSTPIIDGSKSSSSSAVKRNVDNKPNGPFPIIPPGGLFAQGIPKLRPTVPRSGDGPSFSSLEIQSIKSGSSTSSLDHLRVGQLSGSRSQPPSPVSKPRMTSGVSSCRTVNSENENSSISTGNPNFPDDINLKGPAPAPPPASQKPVFKPSNKSENESSVNHAKVKRSASQTNLGQRPRLSRPPPNVKPPPPPKSNTSAPQTAPPPPPSKPPNILRRQSFGVGESHNLRFASNKLSVANSNSNISKPTPKSIGPPPPPPPPRNNSAPNDLNQMVTSSSPSNQWSKMNIAPPPPPNRAVATSNRAAPVRPPPPRAPAPPPPPPPPQHQFPVHPAPPSQLKATPSINMAPPPPARISSIKQSTDFEERFKSMFNPAQNLPKPEKFTNITKTYQSRMNHSRQKQSTRRLPPPPPPQAGSHLADSGRSQPVLHIQLESGIFSNNVAHC